MDLEHEKRMTETDSRSKSNTKRLDDMDKRYTKRFEEIEKRQDNLDDLVSTVKVVADRQERVETDVGEIKNDVKELKAIPGKRWEGIVEKTILTVVGLLIGFIGAKFGL